MDGILFELQNYVLDAGIWGPVVYILAMIVAIIISPIPSSPLAIFAGNIFGTWFGLLLTMVGATLGAIAAFYIARIFGRPIVLWLVPEKKLKTIEQYFSEKNLVLAVFLLRLVPLPFFDAVSYAAGLTLISFRGFFFSTILGLFPLSFIYSYAGDALEGDMLLVSAIAVLSSLFFLLLARVFYYGGQKK